MTKIKLFAVCLVILGVGLAVSITAITQEDVLTIGTTDRITELSTSNSYDFWSWHTLRNTSDALLTLRPNETVPTPSLAESYEVSEGGKVYTFKLRKGVTYTDGTPFDCETMKWSLDRNLWLEGPEGGVGLIKLIQRSFCIDDYTLGIKLAKPDATFLARMVDAVIPSLAVSPASTPANEFAKGNYAGTGPYKLIEYTPEERTVYAAYEDYWGGAPKTSRIVEVFYADAAALRAAVEAGEVDIAYRTFTPDDIADLQTNPNLKTIVGESPSVRYMVFTVNHPPFSNPNLRRALSYSACRKRLSEDVFAGINSPLYTMVPEGWFSHIDAFPTRDLDKARELLEKEGYSEGSPFEFTLNYTPKHYGTEEADVAAVLKGCFEETGMMKVKIASYEWGTYIERESSAAFDVFLLGWYPDYIDPSNFLDPWLIESPDGLGTWLHEAESEYDQGVYDKFVELLEGARETTDIEERTALYEEAQELLAESVILLPLWSNRSAHVAAMQKNVKGVVLDSAMLFRLKLMYKE
jgi:peptide/nickel transport system substrate-binding protein